MATHAIQPRKRIDLSQISYMLIAAGLGAGFMFITDATFLKASDAEISGLRDEVQRLQSSNTGLESQIRDLSARNQDLQGVIYNLNQEKSLLGENLTASEGNLSNKQAELDGVIARESQVTSDAKILSGCVLGSQNLADSTNDFVALHKREGPFSALAKEGIPVATSLMSFHSSWSTGNCASAANLAAEYQTQ